MAKVRKLKTTKGRLLATARIIENDHKLWNQNTWAEFFTGGPRAIAKRSTCGAFGCACGWGVAMTPTTELTSSDGSWTDAGAVAFGITTTTALVLFNGAFGATSEIDWQDTPKRTRARRMVKALRYLASLDDQARKRFEVTSIVRRIGTGEIRNPYKVTVNS